MGQKEIGIISFTHQSFLPTSHLQRRGGGDGGGKKSREGKVLHPAI
jgi:hypothetical protein